MNTIIIAAQKEVYQTPEIEIIQMETEGTVFAGSGSDFSNGGGGGDWGTAAPNRVPESLTDFEGMINDILTFEE